MLITPEELSALGRAFVTNIETGDSTVFDGLRGDEMVTWHNHDRAEVVHDPHRDGGPSAIHSVLRDIRVEIVGLQRCDRGALIEWILRATVRSSGAPLELHNCMVLTMRDGKIVRANEYVDPSLFSHFPMPGAGR